MLCNFWVVSALVATVISAPTLPSVPVVQPASMTILSNYFNLLAGKVAAGKSMAAAPVCDLSKATLPTSTLPGPSKGLTLKHVAIGRGTQNYSCPTTNATAAPVFIGAKATLFNASCIASTYPDLLSDLPNVVLQMNLTSPDQAILSPANLAISGHHFFSNIMTPTFDMDTPAMQLGIAPCSKNNTFNAPAGSSLGQNGEGYGSVAWLKLIAKAGTTGNLAEVYRVNTAGGNPPATCEGMAETFEVQYGSEYWFFESA